MKALGLLMIVLAVLGGWPGPVDPDYAEDWILFIFCVVLGFIGVWMMAH